VVYIFGPCFEAQGGASVIEPETYLYYIQLKPSQPSQGNWTTYDEAAEKTILEDFHRLWNTNFLDNLSIDVENYTFSNGVVGKLVSYNMEERQRVKIVDYVGSKAVETSKIDEALKMSMSEIRLDTFIDPALVRKVSGIVRDMLKEKGFQSAEVTPEIVTMEGGPKLVHLTFHMSEGPKVKIKKIEFVGNKVFDDATLKKKMKGNREVWMFSWINGRGVFQEPKFDEDADKITEFYKEHGYIRANVGVPEQKFISDAVDRAQDSDLGRPPIQGRRGRLHGQHDHQDRVSEAAVQTQHRRGLQREERAQGHGKGARGIRRRGLLGIHGISRL
jgi:hypothetical protein